MTLPTIWYCAFRHLPYTLLFNPNSCDLLTYYLLGSNFIHAEVIIEYPAFNILFHQALLSEAVFL
jgi:hypothetical protein